MLDMGFIPDVERIVGLLPKIRQTLFFSATLGPEIRRLADAFLMNPKEITTSPGTSTATTVVQAMAVVEEIDKRETLRHLIRIEEVKNAFIFCNRKRDVDVLFRSLKKHGFDVVQLHGDMAQSARSETLDRFKKNEARLMVCSDVAARGIDISAVSHVFNFDVPIHAEDYIHRIGRTGRAGMAGHAFTIATPDDGRFVVAIEKLIGNSIPRIEVEGVPALELDMSARKGRGGRSGGDRAGRGDKSERGPKPERAERRPRKPREDVAETEVVVALDAPQPDLPAEPPRRESRPPRSREDRPREDRPREDRPREDRPREDRPREDRGGRGRGRDDRGGRRRGRIDELGIGEMLHPDGVIGFGDHPPDFIFVTVPQPSKVSPRDKGEVDADMDTDSDE
jgi:superfamily II DNA/RNA helicase